MQFLFGAAGVSGAIGPVWEQLAATTAESNPLDEPAIDCGERLRLGVVSRAFKGWRGEGLRVFLDGEILYLDGVPTTSRGHSEAELQSLARLYRRYGAQFWERLDGNFCLIIEDGHDIRIGVDLAGNRTLYYWLHDGVLAFHTYLLDLAPVYPGELSEDLESLSVLLASGASLPGRTPLRQVHHLSPGCHLLLRDGRVTVGEHFRVLLGVTPSSATREQLVDELGELMGEAVGVAWHAAERPVLPLSGGQDSRFIVAEIARQVADRSLMRTITWGTHPERPGSDAQIARRVAEQLGIENVWHTKTTDHLDTEFAHTLYLSSGEADAALTYPDDSRMYRHLANDLGFGSMFRGETVFAPLRPLMTQHALLAENSIKRLTPDSRFRALLGDDVFQPLLEANRSAMAGLLSTLQSPTPTGKRTELYYGFRSRQILGTYHKIKNAYLDVHSPLLSRRVLTWLRNAPDWVIYKPDLHQEMMHRRFPELADMPNATTTNLTPWITRFRTQPELSAFYRERCTAPGWLDSVGAQQRVVAAWNALERAAREAPQAAPSKTKAGWRALLKETLPGRLLREVTLERRSNNSQPTYLLLGRLAVVHELLGQIQARRAVLA